MNFPLVFLILLKVSFLVAVSDGLLEGCSFIDYLNGTLVRNPPFVIIGFVPLRMKTAYFDNHIPSSYGMVVSEAMKFAITEANKKIMPKDLQLSYIIFDDCGESQTKIILQILLKILFDFIPKCDCSGEELPIGTVGPYSSASSKLLSELSSPISFPIISYQASSVELDDKVLYPRFLRTFPTDGLFTHMIADLLVNFNWTFVSVITADTAYGWYGRNALLKRFHNRSICVDIDAMFSVPYNEKEVTSILEKLNKHRIYKSKIVVLYASNEAATYLLDFASLLFVHDVTWILTDGSSINEILLDSHRQRILYGGFTALAFGGEYKEFESYFMHSEEVIHERWVNNFVDSLIHDPYKDLGIDYPSKMYDINFTFLSSLYAANFVRNAVFSYAHAFKEYSKRHSSYNSTLFFNDFLKPVQFDLDNRSINYDKFGNAQNVTFHIINMGDNGFLQKIGEWSQDRGFQINKHTSDIFWVNGLDSPPVFVCSEECRPGFYPVYDEGKICCWVCVQCVEGTFKANYGQDQCLLCPEKISNRNNTACLSYRWISIFDYSIYKYFLIPLCTMSTLIVLGLILIWIKKRNHPIVKASNFQLSITQLVFHLLLVICIPVVTAVRNTSFMCVFRPLTYGTLKIGILTLMTIRAEALVKAFNTKVKITRQDVFITKTITISYVVLTTATNVSIIVILTCVRDYPKFIILHPQELEKEYTCGNVDIVLSQFLAIIIVLITCTARAFRARNLPNKFNESRLILVCVLMCLLYFGILALMMANTITATLKGCLYACVFAISNVTIVLVLFGHKTWGLLMQAEQNDRARFRESLYNAAAKRVDREIGTTGLCYTRE